MSKIAIIFLILIPVLSFSQNQNPSKMDYKSINTEHFEIIFPEEISTKAVETANILENLYEKNTGRLNTEPTKISLVLYNKSTISNAYARVAPRKMGWYITPTQNSSLGITDWFSTLSLHEYSHVMQYQKNKKRFTFLASLFLGDYGWAALEYSIPQWFFEGDAIFAETIFTESGRGRISNFSLPIRTFLLTNQKFNYSQAYLGSFKRYYPNHYYLGYYMVSYVNRNFGISVWDDVLNRTSKFSFMPKAFSRSLKKFTGSNVKMTYKNTMLELDSLWTEQVEDLQITDAKIINKEKKSWTQYYENDFYNDTTIVGLKYSLAQNTVLFTSDLNGNEKIIKEVDAGTLSISTDKVVWARTNPDIRWGEQDYSDIVVYNLKTNKLIEITKEGKYLSPNINKAGDKIVAVEFTTDLKCSLVVLNSENGEIINSYPSIDNEYIRIPSWSDDGEKIVFCNSSTTGQAISILDTKSGNVTEIVEHSFENFSRPIFFKNYILYNSEYSGIGNIYAINIETKQKYQVTSRKFGAYNVKISPDKSKLIFQDYNTNGYDIALIEINEKNWKKIEDVKVYKVEYFKSDSTINLVENLIVDDIFKSQNYEVTDYKRIKNLINVHSWLPLLSPDFSVGYEFYSANKLNDLFLTAGILHNLPTQAAKAYTSVSYQKYFNILDFSLQYGTENRIYDKSYFPLTKLDSIDTWKEANIGLGTWVPLNFSKGLYSTNLTLGINSFYKFIKGKNQNYLSDFQTLTQNSDGQFLFFNYYANFTNFKTQAYKDVRSRFGQSLAISYRHSTLSKTLNAKQFFISANLYFPGVFKNQSLKFEIDYEKQIKYSPTSAGLYYFPNKVSSIRGLNFGLFDEIYKLSTDYELPLLYPDLALGSLLYLKRIKLLAFYDIYNGKFNNENFNYQTTGAQLLFDVSIFNLNYDFEIGLQSSYILNYNSLEWSFLFLGIEF